MKLTEFFDKKEFVITTELNPEKGHIRNVDGEKPAWIQELEIVKDYVHAVNITDNSRAVMKLSSVAASAYLKGKDVEVICNITCRDRNRIALQSDLLGAYSLGIDNVLCLTGDYVTLGDHPEAKGVFDMDSVQLLRVAKSLNEGKDMMGNRLTQATDFALGAAVNPHFEPLDLQVMKMEKKIEAGSEFFLTQAIFDLKLLETFLQRIKGCRVPILVGILFVKSPEMGTYINKHVPGLFVPNAILKEINLVLEEKRKEKVIEITVRLINEMAPFVQGIHFMPLGWSDIIPQVVEEIRGGVLGKVLCEQREIR